MDLGRIRSLKAAMEQEKDGLVFQSDIVDIEAAFEELVASGAFLRDEPENAMALDMLEELEDAATPMEHYLYDYIKANYGDEEEACYSTKAMAEYLNSLPVILGADNGKIGDLLNYENPIS